MFGWLRGIFSKKERQVAGSVGVFTPAQRSGGTVSRSDKRLLQVSEENPNFYKVTDKISFQVARAHWRIFRVPAGIGIDQTRGRLRNLDPIGRARALRTRQVSGVELTEVESHPVLSTLSAGNSHMQGMDVRALIQWYLEVTGFCFVAAETSGLITDSDPMALWPFPLFALQRNTTGKDEHVFRLDSEQYVFPKDRVFFIRRPQPSTPYRMSGTGAGHALATEVSIDEHAAMTANNRLLHDGRPESLLIATGLSYEGVASLKAQLERPGGTSANAGRTHVSNVPVELKHIKLDNEVADLGLSTLRDESGRQIRRISGVPPEKLGESENSNRATSLVADIHFHGGVIDPRLAKLEEVFNKRLLPMFKDTENLLLAYDSTIPSDVDLVQEMMSSRPHDFSLNERRALVDFAPTGEGEDDEPGQEPLEGRLAVVLARDILPQFNSGALSAEQTRALLEQAFRLPEDAIEALLVQPEEPVEPAAEPPATDDEEDEEDDDDDFGEPPEDQEESFRNGNGLTI